VVVEEEAGEVWIWGNDLFNRSWLLKCGGVLIGRDVDTAIWLVRDRRGDSFVSPRKTECISYAMENFSYKEDYTAAWSGGCLDVDGWRFQWRFDGLPGGANDTSTTPRKIARFICRGELGLAAFPCSGVRAVVQNERVQCLEELTILSIVLISKSASDGPKTIISLHTPARSSRIPLSSACEESWGASKPSCGD
jgi:hypothetical protein